MPWIAFKNMTDDDLIAVYTFLKTFPPVRHYINNISPPTECRVCGQDHGFGEANNEEFKKAEISPDLYSEYSGKYLFEDGHFIKFFPEGNKFMVTEQGYDTSECLPVSEKEFWIKTYGVNIRFERDKSNKVTHLVLHDLDESIAQKIE